MIEVRHVPEPDATVEARDQHQFDEAVNRDGRRILEIVAAAALAAAVAMSAVALSRSGGTMRASPAPGAATQVASVSPAPAAPAAIPVLSLIHI